jgi:hypothetical protein
VDNLVFELEVQEGLAKGVHDDVQKANMRAQGLMDERINFHEADKRKSSTFWFWHWTTILELEKLDETKGGRDELRKEVEGLQKTVDYQKCLIENYRELIEEGKVEFEKNCQDSEILNNRVLGEEKKAFLAKRNHDAARTLSSNFQRGLSCQNLVAALLSNLVNKLGFEEFLLIGLCPFCGLGFAPLWASKITSYKHVYHCWCADLHFNISTKCIQARCAKDMHEAWWHSTRIKKPRSATISDSWPL